MEIDADRRVALVGEASEAAARSLRETLEERRIDLFAKFVQQEQCDGGIVGVGDREGRGEADAALRQRGQQPFALRRGKQMTRRYTREEEMVGGPEEFKGLAGVEDRGHRPAGVCQARLEIAERAGIILPREVEG